MSIQRNDSLLIAAPKSVDSRYDDDGTHFANVAAANAGISASFRYQGLTVGILSGGVVTEYWYRDGVDDVDLIAKSYGNTLSNTADGSNGDLVIGGGATTGDTLEITIDSASTNVGILLTPKGTGVISIGGAHTANIAADNDVVTKKYYDDNLPSALAVAGSNTQLQFNSSGVLGASADLTFASSTLTIGDYDIGDSFSGARLRGASVNHVYTTETGSSLVVSATGSGSGSTGASLDLRGSAATSPGSAIISAKGAGGITLVTGASNRLVVSDSGGFNFQGNALSGVLSVASAGNLTIGPANGSSLFLSEITSATPASGDKILMMDASASDKVVTSTISSLVPLFNIGMPTYTAESDVDYGTNTSTVKDIFVGTSSSATRHYWVSGTAEVAQNGSNTLTLRLKSAPTAITNTVTGITRLKSVFLSTAQSPEYALYEISGWITLAASDAYIAMVARGTTSSIRDVRIFAVQLTNNTNG